MQLFGRQLSSSSFRRILVNSHPAPRYFRSFPTKIVSQLPRTRTLSSSSRILQQDAESVKTASSKDQPKDELNGQLKDVSHPQKKKTKRAPAGKNSLRRVAVEAQRSRESSQKKEKSPQEEGSNSVTAMAVADKFDMEEVVRILRTHGFPIDPDGTGFGSDEVIHTRGVNNGDIFVFPSGSLVAWSLPEDVVFDLATKTLLPATESPHVDQVEMEHLEYMEDNTRDTSVIKGDIITLGMGKGGSQAESVDTTFAKIAFSSGLARSTKLAVLETMLGKYFESTRKIPKLLSKGRLPFNRKFTIKKTGELLELRAQLNHYSELTDSLPDIFWDSRHELGLEGYYDQVGKALDVGIRIKTLNQKMDYAQEIATILRTTMSEKHGVHLEWIIIILIAIEVYFALSREWKEYTKSKEKAAKALEKQE